MRCLVCSLDNCQEQKCQETLASIQRLLDGIPSQSEVRVEIGSHKLLNPEDLTDIQARNRGK